MTVYELPKLTPEEAALPISKYYTNYPLHYPNPLYSQLLDQGAMDPADALPVERWLDLLTADGYMKVEYGYCMLPDGTGYIATYMRIPENVDVKKMFWYLNWLNIHPKSQPAGTGNLRYKIWNPADHWDHYFVN